MRPTDEETGTKMPRTCSSGRQEEEDEGEGDKCSVSRWDLKQGQLLTSQRPSKHVGCCRDTTGARRHVVKLEFSPSTQVTALNFFSTEDVESAAEPEMLTEMMPHQDTVRASVGQWHPPQG